MNVTAQLGWVFDGLINKARQMKEEDVARIRRRLGRKRRIPAAPDSLQLYSRRRRDDDDNIAFILERRRD